MMETKSVTPAARLAGEITVPGDKSISHRSVMLGALARGETVVRGFLRGEDNLSTLKAFQAMGVGVEERPDGSLLIRGNGLNGLREPQDVIDCGNSGTTIRLLSGILAGQSFFSVVTGDRYLRKRPMKRVVEPLTRMGAEIRGREQNNLAPLAIRGGGLKPLEYRSPVASAQVKSAILLAGLYADGKTTVFEPHLSRDHSERMLRHFGAEVHSFDGGASVRGGADLTGREIEVPGDISSAAFFLVAGLIVPGSELLIRNVGINPTRSGIIDILQQMGGDLTLENVREASGEPVADLLVRSSDLHGIEIGGDLVPRAIDEFPAVAVAAACAEGVTTISDAKELRVKETDRIAAMVSELTKVGARIEAKDDGMVIQGGVPLCGGRVVSHGDHRIAMSMAVAALHARSEIIIEDTGCTATSFPNFWDLLSRVSA